MTSFCENSRVLAMFHDEMYQTHWQKLEAWLAESMYYIDLKLIDLYVIWH